MVVILGEAALTLEVMTTLLCGAVFLWRPFILLCNIYSHLGEYETLTVLSGRRA
jgi:hypothetical protein